MCSLNDRDELWLLTERMDYSLYHALQRRGLRWWNGSAPPRGRSGRTGIYRVQRRVGLGHGQLHPQGGLSMPGRVKG